MSATYTGFIVTLSDDIGEDEAEAIAAAIRMVRGVASVKAVDADPGWQPARERLDAEWRARIVGLLDDEGV